MRLTVLGSGTVAPSASRTAAAHWVEASDVRLLLDCGAGTLQRAAQFCIPWHTVTHVAISHAKIDSDHLEGFRRAHEKCGLKALHVTDTVPQTEEFLGLPFVVLHSLARRFATTINRLHYNQSVSELFYRL